MSAGFHVIIPARWHSSRLPEKMVADIGSVPMVVRTAQQALKSQAQSVTVATDDTRIAQVAQVHGINTLLTRTDHLSGTDRLAEAAVELGLPDDSLIVNVQGDEPMIEPALIDQVAFALASDDRADMATVARPFEDRQTLHNPNAVKVVCSALNHALYFSRAPIPYMRQNHEAPWLHHIGLYAYRKAFLVQFAGLAPGVLEQTESLEQLRALEHGHCIHVCLTDLPHEGGVDTPEDLQRVRSQVQP